MNGAEFLYDELVVKIEQPDDGPFDFNDLPGGPIHPPLAGETLYEEVIDE